MRTLNRPDLLINTLQSKMLSAFLFCSLVLLSANCILGNEYDYEKPPKRIALVIGNATYQNLAPLPSSNTDSLFMANHLRSLGFEVEHRTDVPNSTNFYTNIFEEDFKKKIEPGSFVIFYFSGHGFSYRRNNYLAMTELSLSTTAATFSQNAVSVDSFETMVGSTSPGLIIFIIDACRSAGGFVGTGPDSVPLDGSPSAHSGGSHPVNSLVSYGTKLSYLSGTTTLPNGLSYFTGAFENRINLPGIPFINIFRNVTTDVKILTNSTQEPVLYLSSGTDPFLKPTPEITAQERELWLSTLQSRNDNNDIKVFLSQNSVSNFADAARKWLKDHPDDSSVSRLTRISPKAIDRAWSVKSGSAKVRTLSFPLGFTRSINESNVETANLSDAELGVTATVENVSTADQLAISLASVNAHTNVVAIRDLQSCHEPGVCGSSAKQIPRGTELEVSGLTRGSDGASYLGVFLPNREQAYIRIRPNRTWETIDLGQPIGELRLFPRENSVPGLIDRISLERAVNQLRSAGWSITRISISTGIAKDKRDEAIATLQVLNTKWILTQSGIGLDRITSVIENEDFAGKGLRVRFFGRK